MIVVALERWGIVVKRWEYGLHDEILSRSCQASSHAIHTGAVYVCVCERV